MRLISATVSNYRVHRCVTVEFDPERTLIGGPNESGKSTLVEAIHRALFLKATVTGEARDAMVSRVAQGHPEVELLFECDGERYQLAKRFSGQTGAARLTHMGGSTWHGEEAESRLADLLGVETVGGGRGILERVKKQWSHLWIWQGMSEQDPSEDVSAQRESLLQRLQQVGGAVAMQSARDEQVASRFSRLRSEILTANGKPRAGSALERAQSEVTRAEVERATSAQKLEALRQALNDYEEASSVIGRTTADLGVIAEQKQQVEMKLAESAALETQEKKMITDLEQKAKRLADLEEADMGIAKLRDSITCTQSELKPVSDRRQELETALGTIRDRAQQAEQAYERALQNTRGLRLKRELAAAWVERFRLEARRGELGERLERVRQLERDLKGVRASLAELPIVDQDALEALRGFENELSQAAATLQAMAAEVEVVAADQPVSVAGSELEVGQRHTVTEVAEVSIGGSVRLRIHPGGGDALLAARERARVLQGRLQGELDRYGLESVAKAAEVAVHVGDLRSREESLEAALRQWDPDGLAEACREAEEGFKSAVAEVDRRRELVTQAHAAEPGTDEPGGALVEPSTAEAAAVWLTSERERLSAAESGEAGLKTARDGFREQVDAKNAELDEARRAGRSMEEQLTGFRAQLELMIRNHGADGERAQKLADLRQEKCRVENDLSETRGALEALQPVLLKADAERLSRASDEADRQKRDAETTQALSRQRLRLDGSVDPVAELEQALARLESAQDALRMAERKAHAICLLDDLFQEEQRVLADLFSGPLAERISAYLQCLFGREAAARVEFGDGSFGGVQLVRSGGSGALDFDELSGGAKEQVAAAVRLAVAELLATDHGGSLPVVFDDAFACSDPERVKTLQRMLDLGAEHGLQIIVLTCNPSDYASLGARQVLLA